MRKFTAKIGCPIPLGRIGENEATRISFDLSCFAEFGNGTVTLLHQRQTDSAPYAAVTQRDGNMLYWDVKSTDIAVVGFGRAELVCTVGDAIAKSIIFVTVTDTALTGGAEPPEPWEDWVTKVLENGAKVDAFLETLEGGTSGQVWTKTADGAAWKDPQGGGGGTSDHRQLTNRDASDQHPINAITGLEETIAQIESAITGKMEFFRVDYTGSRFIDTDGNEMGFEELADKYNDPKYFLYCEYDGVTFIPCLPPTPDPTHDDRVLAFIATYIYGGETYIHRLAINENDQIRNNSVSPYIKPFAGIPLADLTQALKNAIAKAETSVQPSDLGVQVKQINDDGNMSVTDLLIQDDGLYILKNTIHAYVGQHEMHSIYGLIDKRFGYIYNFTSGYEYANYNYSTEEFGYYAAIDGFGAAEAEKELAKKQNVLIASGASVGQIAQITEVDASGKPTAWSPVNMPSGGGGAVVDERVIASGTISAGTAANNLADTGLTVSDLRQWKSFTIQWVMGQGNVNASFMIGTGAAYTQTRIFYNNNQKFRAYCEWVDEDKTTLKLFYADNTGYQTTKPVCYTGNPGGAGTNWRSIFYSMFPQIQSANDKLSLWTVEAITADSTWEVRGVTR